MLWIVTGRSKEGDMLTATTLQPGDVICWDKKVNTISIVRGSHSMRWANKADKLLIEFDSSFDFFAFCQGVISGAGLVCIGKGEVTEQGVHLCPIEEWKPPKKDKIVASPAATAPTE